MHKRTIPDADAALINGKQRKQKNEQQRPVQHRMTITYLIQATYDNKWTATGS
jgi:hypothetical protein